VVSWGFSRQVLTDWMGWGGKWVKAE